MRAATEYRKGQIRIAENTMEQLLLFAWPGNVRQLQNELRRMVALAEPDAVLTPRRALARNRQRARRARRNAASTRADKLSPDARTHRARDDQGRAARASRASMEAAAKALGISRKGLYLKRQRLGL